MILEQDSQEVAVGGAQSVDAFTIKASAKAFQILSSNLYSNPLGSMIRELSTNAYDAHVMSDKTNEPFLIKLPNSLEPSFKIRDYGTGLSHDQIMTVYTTFFESTKTNSNDVVGCLGLGSKSPFGVADSFTVTSFFNGKRTVYSSFLNDARIPSIAKFHEEDTDEENGIEIEVAIKEEDFYTFSQEVNRQLAYFTVKPTVTGDSHFEWHKDEEYLYAGENWRMVDTNTSHRRSHSGPRVVQGQIAYPISTRDMGSKFNDASDAVRSILQMEVLFDVKIGDVNIAPSREALSYDEATVENIINSVEKILEELPTIINEAIQDAPTEWEARLLYAKIMREFGGGYYGNSAITEYLNKQGEILWKNKNVSTTELKIPEEYATEMRSFQKRGYSGNFSKNIMRASKDYYHTDDEKLYWDMRVSNDFLIFYAAEDDKAVDGRVKQYINDNHGSSKYPWIIRSKKSYRSIKSKLGNPTIIKASELDKVRKTKSTKSTNGTTTVTIQKHSGYGWNKSDQWETVEVENDIKGLKGYYVNLDRFDAEYQGRKHESFKEFVQMAQELELIEKDAEIYGLRITNQKREHSLVNFFDHTIDNFKTNDVINQFTFGDEQNFSSKISNVRDFENLLKGISEDSPAYEVIEAVKHNEENRIGYNTQKFIRAFDIDIPRTSMANEANICNERYSFLNEISSYPTTSEVAKYINQMDQLAALTEED